MLCPETLVASITVSAVAIAKGKSVEDLGLLAALFTQLGDTLATIAVQKQCIQDACCPEKDASDA